MKKYLSILIITGVVIAVAGCSTVKGIGQDVTTVGKWLEKSSDSAKEPKSTK